MHVVGLQYIYTHTYIYHDVCMYVCTHRYTFLTNMFICMYVYMCKPIYIYIYIYIYKHIYIYIHGDMYIYVYIYVCVCT